MIHDSITEQSEQNDNIKVYIRIRPPKQKSCKKITSISESHQIVGLSYPQDQFKQFKFTRIFHEQNTTFEVFQEACVPLLENALNGYNGSFFLYGQTGTGKTHTAGLLNKLSEKSEGIIPYSIQFLYNFLEQKPNLLDWYKLNKKLFLLQRSITLSFCQIYLEEIRDLLNPNQKNLLIKEDPVRLQQETSETYVKDLTLVQVENQIQTFELINLGLTQKKMGSQVGFSLYYQLKLKSINHTSSRSHTILTLYLTQRIKINNSQQKDIFSKLSFVDLAGSERVKKTAATGARFEEAKSINTSLCALASVIYQLGNNQGGHIPYRSSRLTRVLQNQLNGQSKISILGTINPQLEYGGETASTLQFCQRCKEVKFISYLQNYSKINFDKVIKYEEQFSVESPRKTIIQEQTYPIHSSETIEQNVETRLKSLEQKVSEKNEIINYLITLQIKLNELIKNLINQAFNQRTYNKQNFDQNTKDLISQNNYKFDEDLDNKEIFNILSGFLFLINQNYIIIPVLDNLYAKPVLQEQENCILEAQTLLQHLSDIRSEEIIQIVQKVFYLIFNNKFFQQIVKSNVEQVKHLGQAYLNQEQLKFELSSNQLLQKKIQEEKKSLIEILNSSGKLIFNKKFFEKSVNNKLYENIELANQQLFTENSKDNNTTSQIKYTLPCEQQILSFLQNDNQSLAEQTQLQELLNFSNLQDKKSTKQKTQEQEQLSCRSANQLLSQLTKVARNESKYQIIQNYLNEKQNQQQNSNNLSLSKKASFIEEILQNEITKTQEFQKQIKLESARKHNYLQQNLFTQNSFAQNENRPQRQHKSLINISDSVEQVFHKVQTTTQHHHHAETDRCNKKHDSHDNQKKAATELSNNIDYILENQEILSNYNQKCPRFSERFSERTSFKVPIINQQLFKEQI